MSATVVIIMDNEPLANAVSDCIEAILGDAVDTVYMTYGNCRLSRDILARADIFVLGLLNSDALGLRAEGLAVAQKFAAAGKRILVIGGVARAKELGNDYYWDVGSEDALPARVGRLLKEIAPAPDDFENLKHCFAAYCRPAYDGHHSRPTA